MYAICYYTKQHEIVQDQFISFFRTSQMNPLGKHVTKRYTTLVVKDLAKILLTYIFFVSGFASLKKITGQHWNIYPCTSYFSAILCGITLKLLAL